MSPDIPVTFTPDPDGMVHGANMREAIDTYDSSLRFEKVETVDLELSSTDRVLVHAGLLGGTRQPKELWLVLFDNYLLLTKPRMKEGKVEYVLWKPPIRVELLTLSDPADQHTPSTSRGGIGCLPPQLSGLVSPRPRSLFPLSIHMLGKHAGTYTLYAAARNELDEWRQKLQNAIDARRKFQESGVFKLETVAADTGSFHDSFQIQPHSIIGRVHCSLPFAATDGREFMAIGSDEGFWIGRAGEAESMRRIPQLKAVTQCAVLEEHGTLLVLSDKSLYSLELEAVLPPTAPPGPPAPPPAPERLSGYPKVEFFRVGRNDGRLFVVYMKQKHRRSQRDSLFRVLEPKASEDPRAPTTFIVFRAFLAASECHDVVFLRSKLAMCSAAGVEIMSIFGPDAFASVRIPQPDGLRKLIRKPATRKPLGMVQIREDEYLLCYDEYGAYVNRHGDPSRTPPTVDWERVAASAAFCAPYVLLFNASFIEVRHAESGRLAQIIPGRDIRCVWDGRGVDGGDPPQIQVHVVLDDSGMSGTARAPGNAPRQHLVALVPTERQGVPQAEPPRRGSAENLPSYVP